MDICEYIESCTKIDTDQKANDVERSHVPESKNVNRSRRRALSDHSKLEKELYDCSNIENIEDMVYQSDDEEISEFPFADIRSNVREVGLGWNIFVNVLEARYKKFQEQYTEDIIDSISSSESTYSYTTATSQTDNSYYTAIEDLDYPRRSSVDIKSETSIDSSIDKSRYKKNALITRLIQSAENDFLNEDQASTDTSANEPSASNLPNEVDNEKKNQDEDDNDEEKWYNSPSEAKMYEDRVFRLLQSKEDEDVYVHPLREHIKEDPVWQEFRLSRKGTEVTETARHYYLNLPDEKFNIFEKVEVTKKPKTKRRVKKSRLRF